MRDCPNIKRIINQISRRVASEIMRVTDDAQMRLSMLKHFIELAHCCRDVQDGHTTAAGRLAVCSASRRRRRQSQEPGSQPARLDARASAVQLHRRDRAEVELAREKTPPPPPPPHKQQLNSLALCAPQLASVLERFSLKFECCSLCSRGDCVLTVVVCVVSFAFASVAELILRCKTTKGVVEQLVKHDAEVVEVSR